MSNQYKLILLLIIGSFFSCEIENELPTDNIIQPPKISVEPTTTIEADENSTLSFKVVLSWAYNETVQVDYTIVEETATADVDYFANDGTLTFEAGTTEQFINVEIIGENLAEPDETLKVELSNPINGGLLVFAATGTIQNDDSTQDLVIPSTGYDSPTNYDGMTLVWQDEFDGESLNLDNWTFEIGTGSNGWGNNELQYYRKENTYLEDGHLIIEAKKESFAGSEYTSSRLVTQGKQNFRFGRIDIRAALPQGQGIWPALWMLGTKFNAVGWPRCGEIDIMELVGHQPNRVHGTVHYGNSVNTRQQNGKSTALSGGAKFSDEFHLFSLIWSEDKLEWYVDDELFHEFDRTTAGNAPYPFNDNFFLIFNVAVGGDWPGSPDQTTLFPQRMIVDYVRYFQ